MNPTDAVATTPQREEALADLVEEITQAIEAGQPVDISAYATRYPQFAEEIKRMVPTFLVLEDLGLSAVRSSGSSGVLFDAYPFDRRKPRRLPPGSRNRPGRDGGGLRGGTGVPGAACGPEGPAAGRGAGRAAIDAVPQRSPRRGIAEALEHRGRACGGLRAGRELLRDGIRRGEDPGGGDHRAATGVGRGDGGERGHNARRAGGRAAAARSCPLPHAAHTES